MVNITFKGTGIKITCETPEEAFHIYNGLGYREDMIINGEQLKRIGPTESAPGVGIDGFFAGYTKGFFEKFFKED